MGVSKVNYGSQTLIDLTGDTVTAAKILSGYTAHNKAGNAITGTCTYDCDSSDATAGEYDIYKGKTAYVNGQKVTGLYGYIGSGAGLQLNSGSTNCSTSQLTIPCDFEPKGFCIELNSGTFVTGTIISVWCNMSNIQYLSKTSSSLNRDVKSSDFSSYVSYDSSNKNLIVKRPSSSCSWGSYNYRIFVFR